MNVGHLNGMITTLNDVTSQSYGICNKSNGIMSQLENNNILAPWRALRRWGAVVVRAAHLAARIPICELITESGIHTRVFQGEIGP